MNLHAIASGAVGTVNPFRAASVRINAGYSGGPDGKRTPVFADPVTVAAQIQPLQFGDLQQIDSLNIQGTRRKIYLSGRVDGLVRPDNKGGDLVTFLDDGTVWKVVLVSEQWPDWVCAFVTLQNSTAAGVAPVNVTTDASTGNELTP